MNKTQNADRETTFRRWGFVLSVAMLLAGCGGDRMDAPTAVNDGRLIRMDGYFEDWDGISPAAEDGGDAPNAEVDLGSIHCHADPDYVHFKIALGRKVNAQRLDGTLVLLLDGDGDAGSGTRAHGMAGVDVIVRFSPEDPRDPDGPRMGVGVVSTTYSPKAPETHRVGHANLGLVIAPTYASETIEVRMARRTSLPETPPLFHGESFGYKLVMLDNRDRVTDETERLVGVLPPLAAPGGRGAGSASLAPREPTDVRVVTWNVKFGGILTQPESASRILRALRPDVLLLQEMTDEQSAEGIEAFLNGNMASPQDRWQVIFGQGGGPLRCAIASRLPLEAVESMRLIPYPDRPDRQVRTVGGAVEAGGRTILVAPVHLKCCGRAGSWEDERRRMEVGLINEAVRAALNSGNFDALVIGGDLNLVGGYGPIEALGREADIDRSDLEILQSYRIQGRGNSTWANPRSSFAPGRLDYILISDSTLTAARSFVFDSADVSGASTAERTVLTTDSATVSDHFPVVVDLRWRGRTAAAGER